MNQRPTLRPATFRPWGHLLYLDLEGATGITSLHFPTSLVPRDHCRWLPPLRFSSLQKTRRGWARWLPPCRPQPNGSFGVYRVVIFFRCLQGCISISNSAVHFSMRAIGPCIKGLAYFWFISIICVTQRFGLSACRQDFMDVMWFCYTLTADDLLVSTSLFWDGRKILIAPA